MQLPTRSNIKIMNKIKVIIIIASIVIFSKSIASVPQYNIRDLGPAMPSVNVRSTDFGQLSDGTPVAFATSNGEPLTFNVLDLRTGESLHSIAIEGETLAGSVHYGSCGSVYFNVSESTPGTLFRYHVDEKRLERVGELLKDQRWLRDMVSGPDGILYISTYPDAKLLAYDPTDGSIRDYGSVAGNATYGYSVEVVGDEVWVGTGPTPNLVAIDPHSGSMRTVEIPEELLNNVHYITRLDRRGDWVFAHLSPRGEASTIAYNLKDESWEPFPLSIAGSGMTEINQDNSIYYLSERRLYEHNLTSGEMRETRMGQTAASSALRGSQRIYDIGTVSIDGREAVVGITNTGNLWRYFPDEGIGDLIAGEIQKSSARVVGFGVGPDGKVYAGAKIGVGAIARLDPSSNEVRQLSGPSQAEGIGGQDNIIVIGDYSGAGLNIGDLNEPWSWGRNPRQIFKLGRGDPHYQDRIWTIENVGTRFALGTIPEPGQNGGALVFVNPSNGEFEVHRHVVKDQSIIDLTSNNGLLYGSTAINGGAGTPLKANEAVVFIWDLETNEKVWEGSPIPGSIAINGLEWTPDDMLWGVSECGELFEFDTNNREFKQIIKITPAKNQHPWGNHSSLVYDSKTDGFWGAIGGRLFYMDRSTYHYELLPDHPEVLRLVRAGNGNIYGVGQTHLYQIETY